MEKRVLKNTKSIKLSSSSSSASLSTISSQLVLSRKKSSPIKSSSRANNSRHEQCHVTKNMDELKLHTRRCDCLEKSANDSTDRCTSKYSSKIKSEPFLRLRTLPKTDPSSSKITREILTKKSCLNGKKKETIVSDWEMQMKRKKIKSRLTNQDKNEKPLLTITSRRASQTATNKISNGKKLRNGKPNEDSTIQLKGKKCRKEKSHVLFHDIENIISDMLVSKKIFTTISIFERKQMLERNNNYLRSTASPKPFNLYLDFKKPVSNSIFKDQENNSLPLNFYPFNLRLYKTETTIVPTKKIKDNTNNKCKQSNNNNKLSTKGPFYLKKKDCPKLKSRTELVPSNDFTQRKIVRDVEFDKKLNQIYARGKSDDGQYEIVVDKIDDRSKNDKQLYVRCHSMVTCKDEKSEKSKESGNNVASTITELEKKQISLMIGKEILDKIGPRRASISAPSRITKSNFHRSLKSLDNRSKSLSFPCSLEDEKNNCVHKKIEFFENIKRNDEGLSSAKQGNKQIKLTRFSMSQSSADFKELFGETQLANYKSSSHAAASSEYGSRFSATSQLFHVAKDDNIQEKNQSSCNSGIFPRDSYLRSVEIGHVKRLKIKFESMEELDRDRNNYSVFVPRKFTSDSQLTKNLVRNFQINDNRVEKLSCKKKLPCKCKSQSLGLNSETSLTRKTSSIPHINYIKQTPQLNEFFASKGFIVDPRVKGIETYQTNIKGEKLSLSSPELNRMRNHYDDSPWIFCRHFQDFNVDFRTTFD